MMLEMKEHSARKLIEPAHAAAAGDESMIGAALMHRPDADHRHGRVGEDQRQRHPAQRFDIPEQPDARMQRSGAGQLADDPAALPRAAFAHGCDMDMHGIHRTAEQGGPESKARDAPFDVVVSKAVTMVVQVCVFDRMHGAAQQYADGKHHPVIGAR